MGLDRSAVLDDDDHRYEPYVRPVPAAVVRSARTWAWEGWQVHVERVGSPDARVRMLLIHGAGGNAAALWPFAAHMAACGAEVTVVDLPGYGRTCPVGRQPIRYADWQRLLVDLVEAEHDDRPLLAVGASMGGMLAVDTAALSGRVSRVVATCLLDGTRPDVRAAVVRAPWLATLGIPVLRRAPSPLARLRVPVRWLAPMRAISNHAGLTAEVLRDRHGGGGAMPLRWFRGFLEAGPAVPPREYAGPPVLLVHPGEDRWTPAALSVRFLEQLAAPTRSVTLPGCGHFPVEEPGFSALLDEVRTEIELALAGRPD